MQPLRKRGGSGGAPDTGALHLWEPEALASGNGSHLYSACVVSSLSKHLELMSPNPSKGGSDEGGDNHLQPEGHVHPEGSLFWQPCQQQPADTGSLAVLVVAPQLGSPCWPVQLCNPAFWKHKLIGRALPGKVAFQTGNKLSLKSHLMVPWSWRRSLQWLRTASSSAL